MLGPSDDTRNRAPVNIGRLFQAHCGALRVAAADRQPAWRNTELGERIARRWRWPDR